MAITGQQLCDAHLSEPMLHYFQKKFPQVPPDELLARIQETLKFLSTATYCSGPIPVSREIDEIWHSWILQTQEYHELCLSLQGGKFIHHSSNDYIEYFDKNIGNHDNLLLDIKMLAIYVENFGYFQEDRVQYWLLASRLVKEYGWSIQELNDWLTSKSVAG
jgi:hypothetical protein